MAPNLIMPVEFFRTNDGLPFLFYRNFFTFHRVESFPQKFGEFSTGWKVSRKSSASFPPGGKPANGRFFIILRIK
jgi:hypothetical protein